MSRCTASVFKRQGSTATDVQCTAATLSLSKMAHPDFIKKQLCCRRVPAAATTSALPGWVSCGSYCVL